MPKPILSGNDLVDNMLAIMRQPCYSTERIDSLVRKGGEEAEAMFSHINTCTPCLNKLSIVAQSLRKSDELKEEEAAC